MGLLLCCCFAGYLQFVCVIRFDVSLLIHLIIIYYECCLFANAVCIYNVDFWRLHFVVNRSDCCSYLFVCLLIVSWCVCVTRSTTTITILITVFSIVQLQFALPHSVFNKRESFVKSINAINTCSQPRGRGGDKGERVAEGEGEWGWCGIPIYPPNAR